MMATDVVNELDEEKIFVGDENEAELDEQKDYGEAFDAFNEDRPPSYQEHESDPLSDFEHNVVSDEDTESLTGSLDGVTGGDEYELTGDDTEYHSDPVTKQNRQEKLRMLALRRHLDLLSEQVLQNDYLVNQSREELVKCQESIQSLEREIEKIEKEIELQESQENKSSIHRLKSQYSKLCSELATEREVEGEIREKLDSAEYSLSLATMEQGRFLLAGEELEKEEQLEMKNKAEVSAGRIRKENITAMAAEKRRRIREKDHITALRERERKHRHAINMAKRSREQASKFLKETMSRVRLKEAEEEAFHRVDMEKRIKNLLSLKNNIESNKESLRAVEARRAYLRNEQEQLEHQEREEILNEGLNPDEVLTRRKRIRQFEKDKETFEKRQRERQIEVADKLLREEKQMKKRYQQQPQLWPDKQRYKRFGRRKTKPKSLRVYSGSSSMEYSADAEDAGGAFVPSKLIPFSSDDEDEFSPFGHTSRDEEKDGDSEHEEDDLAEPEFRGLWEENENSENKNLNKAETKLKFTDHIPSKAEQEMMERALVKQKENIVQKQVAVGREFKGHAFYSKPEVVTFKDFNIGKSYRKKVVLTNVSYTQNFCKYIGMSSHLLDFIDIIYDPPGAMSAGLTCDFTVIFKPMLNEDLVGQIDFLAQTGPFSVPVKCFTKKCQVSVDKKEINFGSQVLGETCKKIIMLINDGALATKFHLKKLQAEASVDGISLLESETGSNVAESGAENKKNEEQMKIADRKNLDPLVRSSQSQQDPTSIPKQQDPGQEQEVDTQECMDGVEAEARKLSDVFTVGKVSCGDLAPLSSVQLELIFAPVEPGDSSCSFEIICEDPETIPIIITAQGTGVDVPVWVDREVVDLKICMYDRLYQDAIVVNNRATSALRLKFDVCKELKNHLELLPKTAYIQAQSQFSAQLKFLPRKTLFEDCPEYFNNETGLLEAPLVIRVADQTRPVNFTVRAIITCSGIEFSVKEVDLGYCTIVESVRQTITMTNKSILAQLYGFCGVPECFEVQPNDGFGTLLPLESLDIDIIFSAKKAQEYNMDLVCKNGIGAEYRITCKGIGVYPPLELSQSTISFRATAVADISIASFKVMNNHADGNEFTHEVPRIGQGPVAKVGPTTFEFVVPPGAPVSISPAVGVVRPGENCSIEVTFTPRLADSDIAQEARRISEKMAEMKRKMSEENTTKEKAEDVAPAGKRQLTKVGKKSAKGSPKRGQTPASTPGIRNQTTPTKANQSKDFKEGSDEHCAAQLSLLKRFEDQLSSYAIPCFVASGESSEPGTLPYSAHNTLYLKVHCPAVRPQLVIVSNCGRPRVDFGQVSVGQRLVKEISIQNISPNSLELSSSILDPHGPFMLLSANRTLESMETHQCVVSFTPQCAQEFYEVLDLNCGRSSLHIRFKGKGVKPVVSSTVHNGLIDFGYALVRDSSTMTFKLENNSELRISFNILLASLSKTRRSQLRNILPLEAEESAIGCSNYYGQIVFDCVPACGTIEPGTSQEIAVTFTADHPSHCYADELSIEVNNDVSETVRLRARASSTLMYLQGFDEVQPNEESLSEIIPQREEGVPVQKSVLMLFKSQSKRSHGCSPVERRIEIGCIKSALQTRKSCEFVFDNPKECNEKGFSFDPIKSSVEAGHKKDIVCRWQPAADHDPSTVVNCVTTITVKGEVVTQYKVLLKGFIVSND